MLKVPPLSLYVHIPWCVRKCPYCDFNSHAGGAAVPERLYVAALLRDLEGELTLAQGRTVTTVFIGGGTPSLFSADAIADLIDGVRARVALADDAEITLEANPGTAEAGKFQNFRAAGINRLSLGVQSFDNRYLGRLGRIHDGGGAIRAAELAQSAGFDNFNLDLMFGLPGQTVHDALADVKTAIDLKPTHISFYQLTLEPNTLFHKFPPELPEHDACWRIQRACQGLLAEHGYLHYEVSAYAKSQRRCRHNVNYWTFGDYLGIGAGAHGKLTDLDSASVVRTWKIKHPDHYLAASGTPERQGGRDVVRPAQLPFEFLMNGLRLRKGFPATLFPERTGLTIETLEPMLTGCVDQGLLERVDGSLRCTDTGYNFLDDVLQRFLQ